MNLDLLTEDDVRRMEEWLGAPRKTAQCPWGFPRDYDQPCPCDNLFLRVSVVDRCPCVEYDPSYVTRRVRKIIKEWRGKDATM